jgi:hypothetical protein
MMDLEPDRTYDASGDDHEEVIGALHKFADNDGASGGWEVTLVVDGDEVTGELVAVRDGVVILAVGGDPHEEFRYGDIESVRVSANS